MDDEKLISLVQERNILYNKYNPNFKIVNKKHKAWMEIANEMGTPGITGEDCMRRWTTIRDRFAKECKRLEESSDDEPKVIWPYFEMMDFVRPFITSRPFRRLQFTRLNGTKNFNTKISPSPIILKKQVSPCSPPPLKKHPSQTSTVSSISASPVHCREFTQIFDDPLNEAPLPHTKTINSNPEVDKSFCEAVEALKRACALNEARLANPAVYAFGEMIVSTICSMTTRNQVKAMQQVTDTVMRIKLEEDELMEQVSYSAL